jgi:hypothetical protein
VQFDDPVDRFGAAVVSSAGGEVGQELLLPGAQGAAQSGDFGDRAGVEAVDDLDRDRPPLGETAGVVGRPELLVAAPRNGDLVVGVAGLETGLEAFDLSIGEPFDTGAEDVADLEARKSASLETFPDLLLLAETCCH